MVVDGIDERNDGIDGELPLDGCQPAAAARVESVQAELAVAGEVVRVVGRRVFVLLILHEEQVAVEAVEGVAKEKGHQAVGPRVCPEDVEDAQARAAEPDGGEELELEAVRREEGSV